MNTGILGLFEKGFDSPGQFLVRNYLMQAKIRRHAVAPVQFSVSRRMLSPTDYFPYTSFFFSRFYPSDVLSIYHFLTGHSGELGIRVRLVAQRKFTIMSFSNPLTK